MIGAVLLLATPTPTTTPTADIDADLVTPGLWGFVSLFVLALAVYFLGRGMARRVQRVNQRARVEAEQRAGEQGATHLAGTGAGRSEPDPAAGPDEDRPTAS